MTLVPSCRVVARTAVAASGVGSVWGPFAGMLVRFQRCTGLVQPYAAFSPAVSAIISESRLSRWLLSETTLAVVVTLPGTVSDGRAKRCGLVLPHLISRRPIQIYRLRIICLLTPSITQSHTPRAYTLPIQRVIICWAAPRAGTLYDRRLSALVAATSTRLLAVLCHLQHPPSPRQACKRTAGWGNTLSCHAKNTAFRFETTSLNSRCAVAGDGDITVRRL
jgi:hypothetical protein